MATAPTFAVVGASLAGAKAAEALREEGFDGRLILIGAERERPYHRPSLSKAYLRGQSERQKLFVHPDDFYAAHDVDLRTGTSATALDPARQELTLDSGERLKFDKLLLTTGSRPRQLTVPGSELDGVFYLREVADADAIRERMRPGARVVVVGAGWIGSEVAASMRQAGLAVTVIDPGQVPLQRVLGSEAGGFYRDLHRSRGVELLLGTGLEAIEGDDRVERVTTTDGRHVECDFVVVGIGVMPRVELAAQAGLDVDRQGILVDEWTRTSAPGIFAAGDVTSAWHPVYDERVHVEHWSNAAHQARFAALNMLGDAQPYDRIPSFFSEQFDVAMTYSGHASSADQLILRGDPADAEFQAFWVSGDRVVAGMSVNGASISDSVQQLIRERIPVDPARLRDPDVALEQLAATSIVGSER